MKLTIGKNIAVQIAAVILALFGSDVMKDEKNQNVASNVAVVVSAITSIVAHYRKPNGEKVNAPAEIQ